MGFPFSTVHLLSGLTIITPRNTKTPNQYMILSWSLDHASNTFKAVTLATCLNGICLLSSTPCLISSYMTLSSKPTSAASLLSAPQYTVLTRAQQMAPKHMGHGSHVVYRSQSVNRKVSEIRHVSTIQSLIVLNKALYSSIADVESHREAYFQQQA